MTFTHALSTNNYGPAKFIVSADAANGTHTTIASALTAASSGDTIFIRQGSYTENLTLKAGVNLCGWPSDGDTASIRQSSSNFNAKIIGKLTHNTAGFVCLSNLYLQTNSDNVLVTSGVNATFLLCKNCYIYASNNTAIACGSTTGSITFENCSADLGTTGITYFAVTSGANLAILGGIWANTGASTTASTYSSTGDVTIRNCEFICPITSSGTAGGMSLQNAYMNYNAGNTTMVTHNSTGAAPTIWDSWILSGTASAVSVGAGASIRVLNTKITSSNTNAITGAGSIEYSGITFTGTSNLINTTTQTKDYVNHGKWKASGQPCFLAYLPSSDANVTGDGTVFTIGGTTALTEVYDLDSNFATQTFTAPVTGKYFLSGNVMNQQATTAMTAQFQCTTSNNDYPFFNCGVPSATNHPMTWSVVADMDAADTAVMKIVYSGGTKIVDCFGDASRRTCFSGFLIA